jgi:hypothetical protein
MIEFETMGMMWWYNQYITCATFEVFIAANMKNAVFWDIAPRGSCKNERLGIKYHLHHHGEKKQRVRNNVSIN